MHMRSQAFPYTVITPPAGDPLFVSLDDARAYLQGAGDDLSDDELTAFIKAAQAAVERFTKLTLFTTEFLTNRDFFPCEITLRRAPLQSIVTIFRLIADVPTLVDASTFKAIDTNQINWGSIVLKSGQSWPFDQDDEPRAIEINFIAGFGDEKDDLPPDLIAGALRVLADLVANRGDCSCDCAGAMGSMSASAKMMLARFRILAV